MTEAIWWARAPASLRDAFGGDFFRGLEAHGYRP